jgi:hypothetical protein
MNTKARRAVHSRWMVWVVRLGFVARATIYGTVGLLALQAALLGNRDSNLDKEGALEAIAEKPFGRVLVVVLACGFAAYASWRLLMAVIEPAEDDPKKAWAKRIGHGVRALFYGGVCVATVAFLLNGKSEDQNREAEATATILRLPLGRWLVAIIGASFLCAGGYAAYRAIRRKYEKKLDLGSVSARGKRWVRVIASVGLAARSVVFLLFAWFLIRAAIKYDPKEAVGLDGALLRVAQAPYGTWLLAILAGGLFLYGCYILVEARYRRPTAG